MPDSDSDAAANAAADHSDSAADHSDSANGTTGSGFATGPTSSDRDGPSYEQAREELADVVRRLETGGATLEESLVLWERGERLATICQEWLDGARARLAAAAKQDGLAPEDK